MDHDGVCEVPKGSTRHGSCIGRSPQELCSIPVFVSDYIRKENCIKMSLVGNQQTCLAALTTPLAITSHFMMPPARKIHNDVTRQVNQMSGLPPNEEARTKNIDEDGLHFGVCRKDLESLHDLNRFPSASGTKRACADHTKHQASQSHLFLRCIAPNIQEVGRCTTMELDNVHCGHCQPCTINHASNLAIKTNVVEIKLGCCDLPAGCGIEPSHLIVSCLYPNIRTVTWRGFPVSRDLNKDVYLGSSCDSSFMANRAFCLKLALSSNPSFASAAISLPSLVSAIGLTWRESPVARVSTWVASACRQKNLARQHVSKCYTPQPSCSPSQQRACTVP